MRKILTILCLFSALSLAAFGQGSYVPPQTALKSVNGVTVPFAGATITVCAAATGGVPCSPGLVNAIFKDSALTQPLSNPFTADANGNYQFAIAPGTYTVTVTGTGFTGYSYQVSVVASSGSGSSGLSNLVSGQVPIANSATTANSSKAIQGSDANLLSSGAVSGAAGVAFCTDGNGGATTSGCAATAVTFNNVGAGTNTVPLVEGTAGSLSPSGSGQIAASQLWLGQPLIVPAITTTLTGGGIGNGQTLVISYTLNTALGETLPSTVLTTSPGAQPGTCNAGASCTITITAPTIFSGYSGYTAYYCDTNGGSGCTTPQKVLACVNITTNCTITSAVLNSGVSQPTVSTAYVQPNTPQVNECPQGVLPWIWTPDTSGNFHGWAGVDWNSNNGQTSGTMEICRRTWFTDMQVSPPLGNNAFVAIAHSWGTGVATNNQDRAVHIWASNGASDSTTHYGLEGLQVEAQFNGTAQINGSPDGEISVISGSVQDNHTGSTNLGSGFGFNGLRILVGRANTGTFGSCPNSDCLIGAIITANNGNTATFASGWVAGMQLSAAAGVTNTTGVNYRALHILAPANLPASGIFGNAIDIDDPGASNVATSLFLRATNEEQGKALLNGKTFLQHIAAANAASAGIQFTNPTCSGTGIGTGSCAILAGGSDSLGRMVLTVSGGTGAGTGTATVTFHKSFTTPLTDVDCTATLEDNTGAWAALAALKVTAHSLSAVTFTWTNGTGPTALANGTYDINYNCWGN